MTSSTATANPRRAEAPERGPERVTVNLTTRTARALEHVVGLTADTKTDAINRAIQVYDYLEEVMKNGGSVFVTRSEGSTPEQVRFF